MIDHHGGARRNVVACERGGFQIKVGDAKRRRWVKSEKLLHTRLQERHVLDVGFVDHSVFPYHGVQLVLCAFHVVWVVEKLGNRPFN